MMKGTLCLYLLLCTAATLASASYDDIRGKAASRRFMQHDVAQSVTFGRKLASTEGLGNAASRQPLLYSFGDDDGPDDDGPDDDGNDDDNSWGSYSGSYSSDDGPDDDGTDDDDNSWGSYSNDDGPDDDGPDDDDSQYVIYGRKLEGADDLGNAASRQPLLYSFGDDDGPDDDGPDDDGNDDDNSWGSYSGSYSNDDGPDDDNGDDDDNSWGSYSGSYSNDDGPDDDGPDDDGPDDDDNGGYLSLGRKLEGADDLGKAASRQPLLYSFGDDDGPDDDGPDDDGNDDDNSWGSYSGSYSNDDGPDDDGPDDDDDSSWGGYSNDDGPDDDDSGPDDDDSQYVIYGRKLKGMKNVGQGASHHTLENGADDGIGVFGNI